MDCVDCRACEGDELVASVEFEVDGLFVKQMHIRHKGTMVPQHSHVHPHLTMLARGRLRAWRDGEWLGDYSAPAGIMIPANTKHTFAALEDETIAYCVHRLHGAEVEIAEEHHFLPGAV